MPILSGKRLGPYEILSAIGAGGMGEVYRAKDTRLNRIVAIKVLPSHLADSPELRERFEREARTIASLNHPHICTLYDVGHQDGTDYLVMEYLEGETLAQRLLKGPLPLDQVLQYAIEITDALDKAHRKGVTHRDLKPGNIMLTKSGTKLLDFGLAKLKQEVAPANVQLSQLPTANEPLTAQGMIVGTLQYMAPEQLEGKQVDSRTDIFAFGAVIYEMATGKRAFEGKIQASVIAKILDTDPPPISSLQPMTPPALDRVVKRCLAKEPDERWQSANDLANELKWIAEGGSQAEIAAPVMARRKSRERLAWSVAALLLLGFLGAMVPASRYLRETPPETPGSSTKLSILPPPNTVISSDSAPAVSPDGRRLAFVARDSSGKALIWIRPLESLTAQPLTDTDDAHQVFWSPDSRFIGFFSQGKLKKVDASGGPAQILCDASNSTLGASWNQGRSHCCPSRSAQPIGAVPRQGDSEPATSVRWIAAERGHFFPLFARWPPFSLSCGERQAGKYRSLCRVARFQKYQASLGRPVGRCGSCPPPPGFLLFVRDRTPTWPSVLMPAVWNFRANFSSCRAGCF